MTVFSPYILNMLSRRAGIDVLSAAGASVLRNDIEATTKKYVALNTVKRLLGLIDYRFVPRLSTLDIFAEYLGFDSWNLLQDYADERISAFGAKNPFIELSAISENTLIELEWLPDRKISIKRISDGNFIVEKAENSKLNKGDILSLTQIAPGFPLIVKSVERDGLCLGAYSAAHERGIKSVTLKDTESN